MASGAARLRGLGGWSVGVVRGVVTGSEPPSLPPRPARLGPQARGARGRLPSLSCTVPGRVRAEGPPSPGTRGAPPSASSRPPRRRGCCRGCSSSLLLLLPPPSPPPPSPPASPRPPGPFWVGAAGPGRGNKSGSGGSGGSSSRSSCSAPPRPGAAISPFGFGSRGGERLVPLRPTDTTLPVRLAVRPARSSPRSRARARPSRPALPQPSRPA